MPVLRLLEVMIPSGAVVAAKIVSFPSGDLTLTGLLCKPEGAGPFPAVLFSFTQAENDQDLSPEARTCGRDGAPGKAECDEDISRVGKTTDDGHSLGYFGGAVWRKPVFAFLAANLVK